MQTMFVFICIQSRKMRLHLKCWLGTHEERHLNARCEHLRSDGPGQMLMQCLSGSERFVR